METESCLQKLNRVKNASRNENDNDDQRKFQDKDFPPEMPSLAILEEDQF